VFTPEILSRFDLNGPRYTSYPTADRLHGAIARDRVLEALGGLAGGAFSLYVHIPFCRSLCYYCACNKIVTKRPDAAPRLLTLLEREIDLLGERIGGSPLPQMALGGGTPNFLTIAEQRRLIGLIDRHFVRPPDREQSSELDPRFLTEDYLRALADLGYNRVSFGVQDFDPDVQRLIHRHQSFAQTADACRWARGAGIHAISFDFVYGLPLQSRATLATTLERALSLDPDRIALFNYAHIPERFKAQRRIPTDSLPSIELRTEMFLYASERLADAGYVAIGLDHFAKPGDSLARAAADGTLRRNFQGYSTHGGLDLVGIGPSAISDVGGVLWQNAPQMDVYAQRLEAGELSLVRGRVRSAEDRLRADVIERIMCHGKVDWAQIEARHGRDPRVVLASEIASLAAFAAIGVVSCDDAGFRVTPQGRLLLRAVAMAFDAYRNLPREAPITYSRIA
jgi:oxygen-independent coproporphyrinogen-3 oxidase